MSGIYGAFRHRDILADGKAIVTRSVQRYLKAIDSGL